MKDCDCIMKKVRMLFLVLSVMFVMTSIVFAGTPQVIINDVKKGDVLGAVVPEMAANGWTVKSLNDYSVVFSQFKSSFWGSVFTGSNSFEFRLIYNVVEVGDNVLVTATAHTVTFPSTSREEITPANQSINNKIQGMLDRLKTGFEGGFYYGFDYEAKKSYWKILNVTPGGSFEKAGIKTDDRIVAINGKPIKDMNINEINAMFAGGEGSSCSFSIERDDKMTVYQITKYYIAPKYAKSSKPKTITPVAL